MNSSLALESLIKTEYDALARSIMTQLSINDSRVTQYIDICVQAQTKQLTSQIISSCRAPSLLKFTRCSCINSILPSELMVRIFGYLSMSELLVAELVCHQWRQLATHAWLMFRQFKAVSPKDLRINLGIVPVKLRNLVSVDFRSYRIKAESVGLLADVARNCTQLWEINLSSQVINIKNCKLLLIIFLHKKNFIHTFVQKCLKI